MKGQLTKQQNRSALFMITAVLLMLVITMVGLTAVVSAAEEPIGETRLNITAEYFAPAEGSGLSYENGIFSKVYDGTNVANLVVSDKALPLLDANHDVSLVITGVAFDKADVNATKIVVTYELEGEDAYLYYAIGEISFNAKITPKELEYDYSVTYNPNGIVLDHTATVAGVGSETVEIKVYANLGVLNASQTAYEQTGIATTNNENYVVPAVNVTVNPIVITSVNWIGNTSWVYGNEVPLNAYANGDLNIFKLVSLDNPVNWAAGNAGGYRVTAEILDAYVGNYAFATGVVYTKDVVISPLQIIVSMPDVTVIGDGKNVYTISVQGNVPADVLSQISYKANGAAFKGFTFGEATVEAVLPTSTNYMFLNAEGKSIDKLTATIKVLCDEKIFPVYDEEGNKVGDVILSSPDGFSNDVTAEITALKGFPKIVKTKYNMVYSVKLIGAAEGQTFSLIIPLTETVFGSRIEKLGVETLSVYEAATGTLTAATDVAKGYTVLLGEGFYQVDGFAGDATFVIAPTYNAPFFQTVWGILLIIVLVIALLVMMTYVGLYLRRVLETREAPAMVIDTIGELP